MTHTRFSESSDSPQAFHEGNNILLQQARVLEFYNELRASNDSMHFGKMSSKSDSVDVPGYSRAKVKVENNSMGSTSSTFCASTA